MIHRELLINGVFIGGACDQAIGKIVIRSPYDGKIVGSAAEAGWPEADAALAGAVDAFRQWKTSAPLDRKRLLSAIAQGVRERERELVDLLIHEIGKPVHAAEGEVARTARTFDLAAEAAGKLGREELSLEHDPRGRDFRCFVERFPLGPILAIVPYNWPLNLSAHKIAPALAMGNTVLLKASQLAPLSTLTFARIIHEAGCPAGVLNAIVCETAISEKMVLDPRIAMVSFTGSPAVGWAIKDKIPKRRVALELGGDASVIVCKSADLEWACERTVASAFGYAGQVCISAQHLLVQEAVYPAVRERMIAMTEACPFGDPSDPVTVCGPLISEDAADKAMSWIAEAEAEGATILAGGNRVGNVVQPTLLENVQPSSKLACEEAFAPVLTLSSFATLDEAISKVNASEYGIHASVFTNVPGEVELAYNELEEGGVIVNDFPTMRFDNMPYGGVKRSGFGREGVRYAMEEMSEPKTLLERMG